MEFYFKYENGALQGRIITHVADFKKAGIQMLNTKIIDEDDPYPPPTGVRIPSGLHPFPLPGSGQEVRGQFKLLQSELGLVCGPRRYNGHTHRGVLWILQTVMLSVLFSTHWETI